jgi:DNA-binding transcriptional LysR family regulator
MQAVPKGSLRVSAPVSFGINQLSAAVATFLCDYQEVDINMVLDDRFVELVAEGFDVAIRIGVLADSSLKARKLAGTRAVIAASPGYLAEAGTPRSIDDLSEHRLLHYSQLSSGNFWRLRGPGGEERQIRVGGRLTVNNGEVLMRAAEAGLGIAQIPSFMLGDAMERGRLIEVLPGRPPEILGIYAVYPQGPFPQPKLRAFIDFMAEHFKGMGPDAWPRPAAA